MTNDKAVASQKGSKMLDIDAIRGAVARGWCAPKNSTKIMDSDLALAISDEVMSLFVAAQTAAPVPQTELACNCGADRTGPSAEAHLATCPQFVSSPPQGVAPIKKE